MNLKIIVQRLYFKKNKVQNEFALNIHFTLVFQDQCEQLCSARKDGQFTCVL